MRRTHRAVAVVAAATVFLAGGAVAYAAIDITASGGARRLAGDQAQAVKQEVKSGPARNVILLIGDGMGDSEITIARNYRYGAAGRLPGIDALPLTGSYTTYSLWKDEDFPQYDGLPDYVTDSAASGTGWSTGTKTYNNAISVDIDGVPQRTLLEIAKANGLRTGDVTTSELQDATPAVQVSHISLRSCYSPSTMTACPDETLENGGLGSITEQLIDTRPDVTLGGGAQFFDEAATGGKWAGKTLLQQATERGYTVIGSNTALATADDLAAVRKADQRAPLLGLFASRNLPVRWAGPSATPTGGTLDPAACVPNPAYPATQPTLAQLTTKAITLLDDKRARKGFFLQVEGASIDKEDHASNACGQIGETIDLDEAVQAALDFARKDRNTLVVVTADHAHTAQIIYPNTISPGLTVNLLTADGVPMTVSYATTTGSSQDHTGSQVRIAAYGPGAANVVGLTDQTDLFFTLKDALRLDQRAPAPTDPWHGKGWGWPWAGWGHRS
jgi:alkaline phosphatase